VRRLLDLRPRLNRRNGLLRARRNIAYHYDLGNDLFELMLDETMTYSCAIFESPELPLADAQRAKYRALCEKLALDSDDHVLEIGCGWGGFAELATREFGCRVTGITISREQGRFARERTAGLPVEILEEDYRNIGGTYSKVVSIEMLEAIGADQFETYFSTIDRVLARGGRAAVQTILVPEQRWDRYRTTPDWIERYVFPGCLIPSLESLTRAVKTTSLGLYGVDEIGEHYAETLCRWRRNVHENIAQVRALGYDARFERTWDFYLAFCEAAFRTRWLRDAQLVLARAE
jgi:cyclopropane-fatty-acyl-phospholipid synthase